MTATKLAQAPLSQGALEKFAGMWVAVRNGDVIAAADVYDELKANDNVRDDDATYHVPPAASLFY